MVNTCPDVLDVFVFEKISKGSGSELWSVVSRNGTGISFTCKDGSQESYDIVRYSRRSKGNLWPFAKVVNECDCKSTVIGPSLKWTDYVHCHMLEGAAGISIG